MNPNDFRLSLFCLFVCQIEALNQKNKMEAFCFKYFSVFGPESRLISINIVRYDAHVFCKGGDFLVHQHTEN